MKNETIKDEEINNLKNSNYKESILFRNIDVKMDIFNTNFEKNLKRFPSNLRFIKKYIYLEFLPKIDNLIDNLEKIKQTSNYDEKLIQLKPQGIFKCLYISCCDLFDNHNIKHMKSNKIIYGTLNGNIVVYDIEINKILNEKFLGVKSRVEIISTSTIKFYDSLISRIAINFRGDPNITILSYNHTYNVFNNECVISLKDIYSNFTTEPSSISLNTLPANIKISKDTFFMTIFDYLGGVRVYKFNEIPQSPQIPEKGAKKDSILGFNFMMGKGNLDKKQPVPETSTINTGTLNSSNIPIFNNSQNNPITANLIGYYKYKEPENYTILSLNKVEDLNNDPKNKNNKQIINNDKGNKIDPKNAKKVGNNEKNIAISQNSEDDLCYHVKPIIDESNLDFSPLIKFNKNHPEFMFIQKKLILDERQNGGFSSCIVTVGIYLGFYGTTHFKYISLYPYLTDNMKNVFKISKSRGQVVLSQEESMSISSTMAKKEKEYINFIKTKLEPIITNINSTNQISQNKSNLPSGSNSNIQNNNYSENTRKELNFTTLEVITSICTKNKMTQKNNLIALGMIDGSILIWDTELHCDKFLFQENKNEILSLSINSNFLTTAAKDGQVYIYDLLKGTCVYNCFHNPYKNFPVYFV